MKYSPKFILKTSFAAIVSGFIIGYALFQAQNILNGPIVSIFVPRNSNEVAVIAGEAKNTSFITMNGRQIAIDKGGNFSEKFVLSDGYNIVKIAAKDKFGHVSEKTIEMVYERETDGAGSLSVLNTHNGQKE